MQLIRITENEQRDKRRFDIVREIRYKLVQEGVAVASGSGNTINISSGGVAFTAGQAMTPGGLVELSISWPMLLDETCPMRLIVFGRVLRCDGLTAVCSIDKYEFRTQSRTFQAVRAPRSDAMLQRWADGMRRDNLRVTGARA